jgi:hypothetical protein
MKNMGDEKGKLVLFRRQDRRTANDRRENRELDKLYAHTTLL